MFTPSGRTPINDETFQFRCHSDVSCFLSCCYDVELLLFPYDIIVLKNYLNIHSAAFLHTYALLCEGSHSFFPGLRLKLIEDEQRSCPFLTGEGCGVYRCRPSACRTYPLERGVERPGHGERLVSRYFLTRHPYCKGHFEAHSYSVRQWEREQGLDEYNQYNDHWAELDAFFATNPWAGEGKAGPMQQLAFMVCYNIDSFREYAAKHALLNAFKLNKEERRRLGKDDGAFLRFGFDWLEFILGGRKKLIRK